MDRHFDYFYISQPTCPAQQTRRHTFTRISNLCIQSLWFWKRFSSFQMFSNRSASVVPSPRLCWSSWERSDMRVTFSIRTSCWWDEIWERETGRQKRERHLRWGGQKNWTVAQQSVDSRNLVPESGGGAERHWNHVGQSQMWSLECSSWISSCM